MFTIQRQGSVVLNYLVKRNFATVDMLIYSIHLKSRRYEVVTTVIEAVRN